MWEYGFLKVITYHATIPGVYFISPDGQSTTLVNGSPSSEIVVKMLNRKAQEGWEVVTFGHYIDPHIDAHISLWTMKHSI